MDRGSNEKGEVHTMAEKKSYDILFLGAGPAGYVGAIRAAQLGLNVGVIEKDKPGGVCLNIGCIPSKALIHQAHMYKNLEALEKLGVKADTSGFDYGKVFKASRAAATKLSKGVAYLLKKNKVEYIEGKGKLAGKGTIELDSGKTLEAKNIILAAGSRPIEIPGFEFDGETILSSDHALMLEKLPKSLLILGGGAIGCEFAYIMNSFGVEVTVVEMMEHLLPAEDKDIVEVLEKSFKKSGITVRTKTKASSVTKKKNTAEVVLSGEDGSEETVQAKQVLVVVGRKPAADDIGLDSVGIETEKGFIPVGDYYQTDAEGVFAVGDLTSSPLLAHVASKEAEIAVEYIAEKAGKGEVPEKKADPLSIPSAVYSEPQVAGFGYTEERAKEEGANFKTAQFPYRGAGKAVAMEEPEGLVKIIFDSETKEIMGARVVGVEATEIVHELLLARHSELLPEDIATMVHAHPTVSEAVMEAARAAEGWAIHI